MDSQVPLKDNGPCRVLIALRGYLHLLLAWGLNYLFVTIKFDYVAKEFAKAGCRNLGTRLQNPSAFEDETVY